MAAVLEAVTTAGFAEEARPSVTSDGWVMANADVVEGCCVASRREG